MSRCQANKAAFLVADHDAIPAGQAAAVGTGARLRAASLKAMEERSFGLRRHRAADGQVSHAASILLTEKHRWDYSAPQHHNGREPATKAAAAFRLESSQIRQDGTFMDETRGLPFLWRLKPNVLLAIFGLHGGGFQAAQQHPVGKIPQVRRGQVTRLLLQ